MAVPVKPHVKRAKPAPAIFANPESSPEPFVSGKATFPEPMASVAAMTDPAAVSAVVDAVAAPAIDTARADTVEIGTVRTVDPVTEASQTPVAQAPEQIDRQVADAAATVAKSTGRTVETVTARTSDLVFPFSKGLSPMATAFDTTKTADMMGDLSTHAKGAMEKSVKFAEEMTEFTKGNVEAIVTSGRVAAKGMESMAHDAAETAKVHFEHVQTTMKSFTQVKSPTELFQLQSDYARSAFDQMVANASKSSEQIMKLMGEIAQPLSNRVALASEKVKSAAL